MYINVQCNFSKKEMHRFTNEENLTLLPFSCLASSPCEKGDWRI